jgi:hypothetical protein
VFQYSRCAALAIVSSATSFLPFAKSISPAARAGHHHRFSHPRSADAMWNLRRRVADSADRRRFWPTLRECGCRLLWKTAPFRYSLGALVCIGGGPPLCGRQG